MSTAQLIRDMARYIQYLENQHECIVNRDEMPSKAWWDGASEETQGNFLRAVDYYKDGTADTWGPLGK